MSKETMTGDITLKGGLSLLVWLLNILAILGIIYLVRGLL